MYNACLGLRQNPFSLSPDPAFFYRSAQHEEAFTNLVYGIESRKGFIALTGEVGTGKTTVLECLRDFLRERDIGYITVANTRLSAQEFIELIAYELRCEGRSKPEVLFSLNQLLIQEAQAGRTIVLIIDEAQNLERDVLEEIRLLGNLEDRYGKLLQIVLAGQPELDRKLDEPDLRQLKQRIVLRCCLRPFSEKETCEYVATRLERAGMPHQTVFPPDVLAEIHRQSKGVPRVINGLCDNLLLMASVLGQGTATRPMVVRVAEEMRLDGSPPLSSSQISPAVDSDERAAMEQYKSEWTPAPHPAQSEVASAPAVAPSVMMEPLPPRAQGGSRFPWIALTTVTALAGVALVAESDLWWTRWVPDTWAQSTPSPSPPVAQAPPIETPPAPEHAWPSLKTKAGPPAARKPFERPKTPLPGLPIIAAPQLAQAVPPSPNLALAAIQSEPAPRRDPNVTVEIKPAPVTALPPPPPAATAARYVGGWSYPSNGVYYGLEPEFAELAIRQDNGHLMGGLSVRFKPASGTGGEVLQFGFGGELRNASIQTFAFETRNGGKGTIELIPGAAPDRLEVNFHVRVGDGRTQSGNMILVKRGASSL